MDDEDCHSGEDEVGDPDSFDEPPGVAPSSGVTDLDEVLDCLTSSARRNALYYLQENEVATVEELARQVAAREAMIPPEKVPEARRERASANLVHRHLPKLADANFVEYDHRSRTVRYTEPPSLLDKVLQLLGHLERGLRS